MNVTPLSNTGLLALLLLFSISGATAEGWDASPEEIRAAQARRWVPAVSIIGGALRHGRQGQVDSAEFGLIQGDSIAVAGFVGLSAELSTPAVTAVPGRPRLFAHADVSLSFDSNEGLANQANPGRPIVPPINNFPALGVQNLGSALRSEIEPVVFSAGAGVAFSLAVGERNIRIKPSIEWLWQEDKLTSLFSLAEGAGANPDFCSPCRTVFIDSSRTHGFHSLGPGLELELEAARIQDFMFSIFLGTQAYRVLGNNRVKSQDIGVWMTDGQPSIGRADTVLNTEYERERWHYRFLVGLRLHWFPE